MYNPHQILEVTYSTEEINNITLETKNFLMYSNINNPNNNISQIFS